MSRRQLSIALLLTLPLWLAQDGIALADNCGSPSDCFFTERAAILALIGIATLAALFIFGPGAAVATLFLASDVAGLLTGRDVLTWKKIPRWQTALGMIDPTPGNVGTRGGKRLVTEGVEETSAKAAKRGLRKTELSAGKTGSVVIHKLLAHEAAFAREIVAHRGGEFVGALKRSAPGIDGFLNGAPAALKETTGGLGAVLRHASVAEAQAKAAGYAGVEVFIKAVNVGEKALGDFALKGPLTKIPGQGVVKAINVLTKDGWVRIIH